MSVCVRVSRCVRVCERVCVCVLLLISDLTSNRRDNQPAIVQE